MAIDTAKILQQAKNVLAGNWVDLGDRQGFTKPAAHLYPFQWNWDSAFIAYGYAYYDPPKAIAELRALFLGQWANGFLPHIVFHRTEGTQDYFPGPDVWDVQNVSAHAPKDLQTSGIGQPPLQAMALWHLYGKIHDPSLLEEFYPKLLALHRYLFTARDPEKWGLITIYHPWESGLDNSPRWDRALERVETQDMSKYRRHDTGIVSPKYRPSDEDYGRYLTLVQELKRQKYDDAGLYPTFPFRIKDVLFSSIAYLSNKRLCQIAETLGEDTSEIKTWMERFEHSLMKRCWNEEDKLFYDVDLITGEHIRVQTVAALMPMITGLPTKDQIHAVSRLIRKTQFCEQESCTLAPSTSVDAEQYNPELYWRGPVWINMNWFIWKGFRECQMLEAAGEMKGGMLALISEQGFWEYYSPRTGKGLGAENFSWSAALIIDLLLRKPLR